MENRRHVTPTSYGRKVLQAEALEIRLAKVGTRHDTIRASAYRVGTLVPSHIPEPLARALLTEAARICASATSDLATLSDDEIEDTISAALAAGMASPRVVSDGFQNREDAVQYIDTVDKEWCGFRLGGWEGRRCHAVMPAILRIAREIGGPRRVPLPLTKLSIYAGTTRATCSKALKDLEQLGWLTKASAGGPGRSARYDIHRPNGNSSRPRTDTTLTNTHQWQRLEDAMIGHDASRPGGISPTGMRILKWLSEHPGAHRQAHVARALGISAGTVGRHVKPNSPLVRLGVIERDERASIRTTADLSLRLLDLIADRTGTIGRRDRDRRRLRAYFQQEGFLDDDMYWLDPTDGSRRSKASWLLLEHAIDRLATAQAQREDSA